MVSEVRSGRWRAPRRRRAPARGWRARNARRGRGERGLVEEAAAGGLDQLDGDHRAGGVELDADGGEPLDARAAGTLGIGGLDPVKESGRHERGRHGRRGRARHGDHRGPRGAQRLRRCGNQRGGGRGDLGRRDGQAHRERWRQSPTPQAIARRHLAGQGHRRFRRQHDHEQTALGRTHLAASDEGPRPDGRQGGEVRGRDGGPDQEMTAVRTHLSRVDRGEDSVKSQPCHLAKSGTTYQSSRQAPQGRARVGRAVRSRARRPALRRRTPPAGSPSKASATAAR